MLVIFQRDAFGLIYDTTKAVVKSRFMQETTAMRRKLPKSDKIAQSDNAMQWSRFDLLNSKKTLKSKLQFASDRRT